MYLLQIIEHINNNLTYLILGPKTKDKISDSLLNNQTPSSGPRVKHVCRSALPSRPQHRATFESEDATEHSSDKKGTHSLKFLLLLILTYSPVSIEESCDCCSLHDSMSHIQPEITT